MDRNYKNTFCGILILAILLMAVGYSILSTRLNVEGTSKITSDFNIQITGIREIMTDGLAETASVDYAATSASYSTNLQAPGDIAIYEITVENKGNQYGYVNPKRYRMWYDAYVDYDIMLGVVAASRNKIAFSDYEDFNSKIFDEEIDEDDLTGKFLLAPGEKIYYYAASMFHIEATSLPENKNFSNEINFTFKHVDANGNVPNLVLTPFIEAVTEDNPVVTSGNGVYYDINTDFYYYKTDYSTTGNTNVNNYLLVDDILWRIVKFDESNIHVIQDEETINDKEVFSTEADENGYYNNVNTSTLLTNKYYIGRIYLQDTWYDNLKLYYVPDTEVFAIDNNRNGGIGLISVEDVLNSSVSSSCTFANLSNGGCHSWLTDNGNTYLFNEVYAADKVTNTGKIAYLQDDKVIAVDPTDESYGEYKLYGVEGNVCHDIYYINNSASADGSREKPYRLDSDAADDVGPC